MGETFTLNLQHGTRAKNYQFAFTEPYLFNLPANFGIDIFKTYLPLPLPVYARGGGLQRFHLGPLLELLGDIAGLQHGERLHQRCQRELPVHEYLLLPTIIPKARDASPPSLPTLYYSTVDSPIFPSSGSKFLASYRYSGGFLGGDIYLHKLKLEVGQVPAPVEAARAGPACRV